MFTIGRLSTRIRFSIRSISQIKKLYQHQQHQQKLTGLSTFQLQPYDNDYDGGYHSSRGTRTNSHKNVPVAYLAFLLFFKEADCSSDCDHLVDAGEGDCNGHGHVVVKIEQACRKCPIILPVPSPSPSASVEVPPPADASVPQVKASAEVVDLDVKENCSIILPAAVPACQGQSQEQSSSSPSKEVQAPVPVPCVQVEAVEVQVEIQEKEENFEIKSLETQINPIRKSMVSGHHVNEVFLSSTTNTSKLTCEEANVDKSLLSKVLNCLGFTVTTAKIEEIKLLDEVTPSPSPAPKPCPLVVEQQQQHLIIKEEVQLEKSLKLKGRNVADEKCHQVKVAVADEKFREVMIVDDKDKYKKKDNENVVNGNDCGSTSLLTSFLKPFNYCISFVDFSQNEDYSDSAYAPPIYPPNCECKPPANVLSLDSINRILSETISTLHDLHIEYRVLLRNLWDLLNERLVVTCGVKSELLDCNILYVRGRIEDHSKSMAELDCYLSQVLNLVDCAAEVASCGGADVASHIFCDQYSSMLYQIKAIKTETQCVEDNLADFQKVFYVKTGQALI